MIIGLIGFKQVGKSTAAKHLIAKHGFVLHNMKSAIIAEMKANMADTLNLLGPLYNMTVDELFDKKPPLMRALMVDYGMMRRKDRKDYWINSWNNEAYKMLDLDGNKVIGNIVADDIRFTNESTALQSLGGILIRLTRSDITTGGDSISETEHLQIVADFTIECEPGNPEKMYKELDKIVAQMV